MFRRPLRRVSLSYTLSAAFAVSLVLSVSGCAAKTARAPDAVPTGGRLITREEIQKLNVQTLWDVLRRTGGLHAEEDRHGRPADLLHRGRGSLSLEDFPLVFLNGARIDDLYIFQDIRADNVNSIRILSGPEATIRYGTNSHSGVILITTGG